MLNSTTLHNWDALDEAAVRAGGYLAKPKRPLVIEYDYRAMTKYSREKGISMMDLTDEELKRFEYAVPLVYA
ncbi:MAG: hypothetical protein LBU32_01595 [Clostridiales bacterium]|jgi:hypothetical protein|nr:hypothetical protein [Clostridiales bacterium]